MSRLVVLRRQQHLTFFLFAARHVSLVKVQGKEFEFEPIRLRSVRPFIFEEIKLADVQADNPNIKLDSKVAVAKYLKSRVNDLIIRANEEWDELHKDDVEGEEEERLLPLIRIRVRRCRAVRLAPTS